MPAVSQAQYHLMQLVAAGKKKLKGLSRRKAREFIQATPNPSRLPRRVKKT
jgi:hypothetical protein